MELGHTVGVSYEVYQATVSTVVMTRFPGLGTAVLLGGMITTTIQCFFAMRLYRLLPRPYCFIGVACMIVAGFRCIGGIVLGRQAVLTHSVVAFGTDWFWLITTLLVFGAAIDVVIAASLIYFLLAKQEVALTRVAKVIDRLATFAVRSGLLTSITAVATLICYLTMSEKYIWMAVYTVLVKMYSNSLLSALNGRTGLRSELNKATSARPGWNNSTTAHHRNDRYLPLAFTIYPRILIYRQHSYASDHRALYSFFMIQCILPTTTFIFFAFPVVSSSFPQKTLI